MRGFNVERCPICGDEGAEIHVVLDDVTQFRCLANECEFTEADVKRFIAEWYGVLKWTEQAPEYDPETKERTLKT